MNLQINTDTFIPTTLRRQREQFKKLMACLIFLATKEFIAFYTDYRQRTSLMAQVIKNPPAIRDIWV